MTSALVSKPDTAVQFFARRPELVLVYQARYPIYGPGGEQVGEKPGIRIPFAAGVLRIPPKGNFKAVGGQVPVSDLLAWLEQHPLNGDRHEGFWRADQPAPPVSTEESTSLMEASLDEDMLVELIRQEESGWNRDQILVPARRQLEQIRDLKASAEAAKEK